MGEVEEHGLAGHGLKRRWYRRDGEVALGACQREGLLAFLGIAAFALAAFALAAFAFARKAFARCTSVELA